MSAMNTDEPAQESTSAIDTQQLQHQDILVPPSTNTDSPVTRKPKTPSVRRACVACHTGKTRCSEHLPCQSCIKRGLASTCAYPDPDADHQSHQTPGMPHAAHLHEFAVNVETASAVQQQPFGAPPPMYATLQGTTTLSQQQYYDYNGAYTGASTSTFRPNKRPRNLTEEETAAIRNFTRGDFFIGNNAPVIDGRSVAAPSHAKQCWEGYFLTLIFVKIHFANSLPRPPPGEMDTDMLRLWQLVHELSEQLAINQKITATLQAQAGSLKTDASHAVSGFALRRFNTDIAKENFESELERQSARTVIENQVLLHENKQLSQLLKEYEQTMETIMSKFRNHALAAQRHELTLTRHYETLLQARETHSMSSDLLSSTEMAQVLRRLSHHLRGLLHSLAGETPDPSDPIYDGSMDADFEPDTFVDVAELERLLEALDDKGISEGEWAVERETEIARLEKENAELRRLLEIDEETMNASGIVLDPIRDDPARFAKFVPRRVQEGGDPRLRPGQGFWGEPLPPPPPPPPPLQMPLQHEPPPIIQGYLQGPGSGGGPTLQRALDLQPGMRVAMRGQGRRPGIIGRGARRGGFGGIPMGDGWQPAPPAPWQGPGPQWTC
ncbi:hypothetical protein H0H93_005789 [Arthromyces matolae]|nr:hypothetical protein H0H93_005789 [Arthromyces matolae]